MASTHNNNENNLKLSTAVNIDRDEKESSNSSDRRVRMSNTFALNTFALDKVPLTTSHLLYVCSRMVCIALGKLPAKELCKFTSDACFSTTADTHDDYEHCHCAYCYTTVVPRCDTRRAVCHPSLYVYPRWLLLIFLKNVKNEPRTAPFFLVSLSRILLTCVMYADLITFRRPWQGRW